MAPIEITDNSCCKKKEGSVATMRAKKKKKKKKKKKNCQKMTEISNLQSRPLTERTKIYQLYRGRF